MAKPKTAEAKTDTKANETVEPPKPEATIGRELTEDEKKALAEAEKIRADAEEREWIEKQKFEIELAVDQHEKAEARSEELRALRDEKSEPLAKWLHERKKKAVIGGSTYKAIEHKATHDADGAKLPGVKGKRHFARTTFTLVKDSNGEPV